MTTGSARGPWRATAFLITTIQLACTGRISDEPREAEPEPAARPTAPERAPAGAGEPPPPAVPAVPAAMGSGSALPPAYPVAVAELRRLTRREYDNTVRDLLGDSSAPARAFGPDAAGAAGYEAPGALGSLEVDALMKAAEKIAAAASARMPSLLPCAPKTGADEEPCARDFIRTFAPTAFRRPVAAEETADLLALYQDVRKIGTFSEAIAAVIQGVLQAPSFLYHRERGAERPVVEGDDVRLTNHELASRLSYLVAGTMPDASLLQAAAAGRLVEPAVLEAQARRLAARLPVLGESLADFGRQWLHIDASGLEKNRDTYPDFAALKPLLAPELLRFFGHVAERALGPDALFTDRTLFVNRVSAKAYGLPQTGSDALAQATGPAGERAGVFTQLAFLSTHATATGSHPVTRGLVMLEQVLCGKLPPAPPDVPPPKPPQPNQTTRERFAEHSKNECAGCHRMLDPLGFSFEGYDGIGRFRTTEAGRPVDASGTLTLPSGGAVDFRSAVDLLPRLASSADVRLCLARHLVRYGAHAPDGFDVDPARETLAAAGDAPTLADLLLAVVKTRAFRYRRLAPGEVL